MRDTDQWASYSPEDNKLRLYVGRVPRDEYERLRAEGWTTTPKQAENGGCNFVATWTPQRRDTALEYGGGVIEDEDQPMAERAADRAERFGGYRDKRLGEAVGHADRYDSQPSAHGYQSQARAERMAARHDRIADRAGDAWSKAEYWQHRTAGVISHALYKSTPGVRMGRIKVLEAELRKFRESQAKYAALYADFQKLSVIADPEKQTAAVLHCVGTRNVYSRYMHPRPETVTNEYIKEHGTDLFDLMGMIRRGYGSDDITGAEACALFFSDSPEPKTETDWTIHLTLRLAYENQMLEAQGGRAAFVEMVPGGWLGSYQIHKVNKSTATGRVVSVNVLAPDSSRRDRWGNEYEPGDPRALIPRYETINIERFASDVYRPPTAEDLEALKGKKADLKAKAPKKEPCPLINPTDEDAERLQAIWNERAMSAREAQYKRHGYSLPVNDCEPQTVLRITQAQYSANSKGEYARCSTRDVFGGGVMGETYYNAKEKQLARFGLPVCQVRQTSGGNYSAHRVIILTDKPQKEFPAAVWKPRVVAPEAVADGAPKTYAGKSRGLSYTVNA